MNHRNLTTIENDILCLKENFDARHLSHDVHPTIRRGKLPAWRMLQDAIAPFVAELKATKQYEIDEFKRLHPEE